MKAFICYLLSVMLCIVMLETAAGISTKLPNTLSVIIEPSPNTHSVNSSSHHKTLTPHSTATTTHNHSSTVHHNHSSTVHHNHSSTVHHNHSSTVHHNHSSTVHHNHSSTVHYNHSSIYHNSTSSIMPSPSVNFSISINMTSETHNASHMTYTISPTQSINPNITSTITPTTSPVVPTTTPPPKLPTGKFSVKKDKKDCLLMWLSLEFTVKYKNVSSGKMIQYKTIMPNASSTYASGTCENGKSSIRISWGKYYYMEATFITTKTAKWGASKSHWIAQNLTYYAQVSNNSAFANHNTTIREIKDTLTSESNVGWLHGQDGNSFNCSQNIEKSGEHITALFENLRIQPFGVQEGHFSTDVDNCFFIPPTTSPTGLPSKKKPKKQTVAIAVGCSLAGLVLIVLIGYFIGKRRKNSVRYRKL